MNPQTLLETLNRLRALPREAATVEFKSNLKDPVEIGQTLSALANAAALAGEKRVWLVWAVDNATYAVKGTAFDPFTKKAELDSLLKAKGLAPYQPRATPWVTQRKEDPSPEGATQPQHPSLCRPFRAKSQQSPKPRAMPWAGVCRAVGAEE